MRSLSRSVGLVALVVASSALAAVPVGGQEAPPDSGVVAETEDSHDEEPRDVPGVPAAPGTSGEVFESLSVAVGGPDDDVTDDAVPVDYVPPPLVAGVYEVDVDPAGGRHVVAETPLAVEISRDDAARTRPVDPRDSRRGKIRVSVSDDAAARPESSAIPLFTVDVFDANASRVDLGDPLRVELSYAGWADARLGYRDSRLELRWYDGCSESTVVVDEETGATESRVFCDVVAPLETVIDPVAETVSVLLDPDDPLGSRPAVAGFEGAGVPVSGLQGGGGGGVGFGSGGSSAEGSFSATPLSAVADYQVGLYTGSFETSYPIPVPPSAAGAVPSVSLVYSSGSVDGMLSDSNNQASTVGVGWSLAAGGSITRHVWTCRNNVFGHDLCPLDDDDRFSLSLNGTSAVLVHDTGNKYRLESDAMWVAELEAGSGLPDSHDDYWRVTTPDGTEYEFGRTDDSQDWVPMDMSQLSSPPFDCHTHEEDDAPYSETCDKAWRWNLNKVTDPNGNVISYKYEQEFSWYRVRAFSMIAWPNGDYVRASHVTEIEYATNSGAGITPKVRVRFLTELRCSDPLVRADCNGNGDFLDTPIDLVCRHDLSGGGCGNDYPTFFTERRLDGIQTLVKESGEWRIVDWWDLSQTYPDPTVTGDVKASEPKLWLDEVVQRPESETGARSAFQNLEAESYDDDKSISFVDAADYGASVDASDPTANSNSAIGGTHNTDWVRFDDVDFGTAGVSGVLARVASDGESGSIKVRLDSATGTLIATVDVSDTGGWNDYETEQDLTISGNPTGVHDVYFVFEKSGSVKLADVNWFRFVPSSLPGLPETDYDRIDLKNRAENLSALNAIPTSPMRMPRVDHVDTALGGEIDVTYGQDYGWDSEPNGPCHQDYLPPNPDGTNVRNPCDYFVGWADGFAVHFNKFKVKELTTDDTFSENNRQKTTYEYSRPAWRHSDNPGYANHDNSACDSGLKACNHWNDFRGHGKVTVKQLNTSDGTLTETERYFYQGMDGDYTGNGNWNWSASITLSDSTTRTDHNWLAGREADTRSMDGSSPLVRTVIKYDWFTTVSDDYRTARFVAPDDVTATTYGSTDKQTRVEYVYDQTNGNPEREIYHGDLSIGVDDRNVEHAYATSSGAETIFPKYEKLWAGTSIGAPDQELRHTKLYYDDLAFGTVDVGNPTSRRDFSTTTVYSETELSYDAAGRLTTVTDPENNVTTNGYDTNHGYLASVTNDLGHATSFVVDPGTGAPVSATDPNGNQTVYSYDEYQRLVDLWRPTENPASDPASFEFAYYPAQRPAKVVTKVLTDASTGNYVRSVEYHDGFGRAIQTQTNAPGDDRYLISRYFNALGLVRRQSGRWLDTNNDAGDGYLTVDWGGSPQPELQTVYSYDEVGRVTLTETLDNESPGSALWAESVTYDAWNRTVTDRNGVESRYHNDGFGNLVTVVEDVDGGAYTTDYTYDLTNQLMTVTDDTDTQLQDIEYDLLGRKTAMSDADSGDWSYTYDDNGNLETQTDGRGTHAHLRPRRSQPVDPKEARQHRARQVDLRRRRRQGPARQDRSVRRWGLVSDRRP